MDLYFLEYTIVYCEDTLLWILGAVVIFGLSPYSPFFDASESVSTSYFPSSSRGAGGICSPKHGLRPFKTQLELGAILEEMNYTTGVEVGVKQGDFAQAMLSQWKSCKAYLLVDLWAHQKNYKDIANVPNDTQEKFYQDTQEKLKPYSNFTKYYRMLSTEAAKLIPKESLDFAFIDARHDYCGVLEDLTAYWPLLKPGGIMAGHDFLGHGEVRGQDWSVCADGSVRPELVKGAVLDFTMPRGLTVSVTYQERRGYSPSWMVQKPLC